MITVTVTGSREASTAFRAAARQVRPQLQRGVDHTAALLLTTIRANASTGNHPPGLPHIPGTGPGPNVATGDYRRSWQISRGGATIPGATLAGGVIDVRAAAASATVETDAVQATRLEHGFFGRDGAGRTVRQPAYPHVAPAVAKIEPVLETQAGRAVDAVLAIAEGSTS